MKRILLIAIGCLVISAMIGCDTVKDAVSDVKDKILGATSPKAEIPADDGGRSELEDADMKYVNNTDRSLTVELTNNTDSVWQSGNMRDYTLEYERDGVWYTVEPKGDFANTMELMLFCPEDTLTHTFDFSERYGTLKPGNYRLVKAWWANASATREAGEFYTVCEFSVE
jgi:hypothetical protein